MAFPRPPTLAEVRRAVAIRLKVGAAAAQSPAMKDVLDEYIAQAVENLNVSFRWVRLRTRRTQDLIDDQSAYDMPDGIEPGRIERVIVIDDDGDEFELASGITPLERSQLTDGDDPKDLPLRYEFIDEQLRIYPPPDTERYVTLAIEGYLRVDAPRNNDDAIAMQKEAVVRSATAIGKHDLGHKDAVSYERSTLTYLRQLRPMESDGESIRIGGHFSRKFRYQRARRIGAPIARDGYVGENYWLLDQ